MVTATGQMKKTSLCARLLQRTDRTFEGLEVSYGLFETANGHLIEVTLGVETVFLFDRSGSVNARRIYELLVKGGVTPCTASDIFEDLMQDFDA